ncbi:FeoA domain-containing protein [Tropicimonas sp. TH_r6]|uniref:metal-dependent transcriptional regulator n=1 Tax=Tropicimonas sp. TH_r6 TaxID=3082085 RepID=UPI002952C2BD|nr:FeoA domain-containing protein [Tropicimonas sp. TH_r6]MDV7144051.1 FeoA domain-containing protein [Tropicimonas sp. TH_r6]
MEKVPIYTLTAIAILALLGLMIAMRKMRQRRREVLREDILKHLCSARLESRTATVFEIGGRLELSPATMLSLVKDLEADGFLSSTAGSLELTEAGERKGRQVLRAHRFWERYLADEAREPLEGLHDLADRAEHRLGPDAIDALSDHLGHPRHDPHGDVIPAASGEVTWQHRAPLTDWPCGRAACVVHVEDEPGDALKTALEAGLHPGKVLRVLDNQAGMVTVDAGVGARSIAAAVAAKIDVREPSAGQAPHAPRATLADLSVGDSAEIVGLKESCHGLMRRRLLDLGFTQGARISAALSNAGDAAHAYRLRGTMIALRREQAEQVLIGLAGHGAMEGAPERERVAETDR